MGIFNDLGFKKRGSDIVSPDSNKLAGMTTGELATWMINSYGLATENELNYTPVYSTDSLFSEDIDGIATINGLNLPLTLSQDTYEFGWRKYKVTAKNISDGTTVTANTNTLVEESSYTQEIVSIDGTYMNASVLMNDGTLKVAGTNNYGMFGINGVNDIKTWAEYPVKNIRFANIGFGTTFVITENNELWHCGRNDYGNGGAGYESIDRFSPVLTLNNVDKVFARNHQYDNAVTTFAVLRDGSVKSAGYNGYGFRAVGDGINNDSVYGIWHDVDFGDVYPVDIKFSYLSAIALMSDGTIRTWGNNGQGQLGTGGIIDSYLPFNPGLSDIKEVHAGYDSFYAVTNSGGLYVCGNGYQGRIGTGSDSDVKTFTKLDYVSDIKYFTCTTRSSGYVTNSGELYVTGANNSGMLGDGTTNNIYSYTKVLDGVDWFIWNKTWEGVEYYTGFAKMNDGTIMVTGESGQKQSGMNTEVDILGWTPHTYLNELGEVDTIFGSRYSRYVKMTDGRFVVFGDAESYALGTDSITDVATPTVIDIFDTYTTFTAIEEETNEIRLSTDGAVDNLLVQLWV